MSEWLEVNDILEKVFVFSNFVEAVGFVDKIVPIAEEMDHHPDLEVFDYKKVRVKLVTHSAGKITEKDYAIAERLDELVN